MKRMFVSLLFLTACSHRAGVVGVDQETQTIKMLHGTEAAAAAYCGAPAKREGRGDTFKCLYRGSR